ncbi:hypothetical protein TRFO_12980 [Tritrichomonas foetus]|uniref:protein disulfide-isomerase n=1 Tax=Tritrichomonas foetus TaxID=1144522 RepID=A0A1J4KZN6_9EUKA|nr:hypothetical protein TRFO_12980 [Tritrichomonas foetus]|eukprot:OHT16721.1 hypothetical protein TRFO_12980 [Tritrichomonas foetus]
MFFVFFGLIASIYVPYTDPHPLVRTVSEEEAQQISRHENQTIVVALTNNQETNDEILETLSAAAIYFKNISFCVFNGESNAKVTKENEIEAPAIFLYIKGIMFANYIYPDIDTSFLSLCNLIIKPPKKPITSLKELYSSIGTGPFTIIAPPKKVELARLLQYRIGNQLGIVDILNADGKVLLALGINETSLALVRKEDMCVVPIDFDIESVFEASNPVYRVLMNSDITGEEDIVFSIISEEFEDNERDFLFEVGQRFPNFIVGYANQVSDYIQKFNIPPNGDDTHEIVVFNLPRGIYYNCSSYFGKFKGIPFDVSNWVSAATKMLNDISKGTLQPSFMTEDPSDPTENDPFVTKVVGTTYESFVMDPEHDVVMLYKRENCPHCVKFFPTFSAFAKECAEAKLDFVKFGFIDISKNSAPIKYPYMPGVPHVQIFPAKNKTDDNPLHGGRDRFALIRLLKAYSSGEIPFEAPLPDKGQIAMEMMQMLFGAKDMPEEEKIKTFMYMDKMSKLLNLTEANESKDTSKEL